MIKVDADGQGSLACSSPWGRKVLDTTEQLKCTEWLKVTFHLQLLQNSGYIPCIV